MKTLAAICFFLLFDSSVNKNRTQQLCRQTSIFYYDTNSSVRCAITIFHWFNFLKSPRFNVEMMIRFQRAHSSANHFGLPVFILPLTIGYWLIALSKQKNSLASICCCCIDKETARHPAFKVADVWDNNIINQPFRRCQRECHRRATATLRTSYYFSLFFFLRLSAKMFCLCHWPCLAKPEDSLQF